MGSPETGSAETEPRSQREAIQALQYSEQLLQRMIASIHDYAIFMLDPEGRVISWNPGAERIIGYAEDEIIGRDFSVFFSADEVARGKPAQELEVAARDGRFEDESWRIRKDGSQFWASVVINAVHDASGRLVGFAKITRDLTERRNLEAERLQLARTQEAIRLRDEFLSIASHELKTPLTAMQLQLHGVRELASSVDDKLVQRIERALRAGDRLASQIEALLDVSRLATGKLALKPERFNLVEAAEEVIEHLHDSASRVGCTLKLIPPPHAVFGTWDRFRVEQILTNLVSNAIKYAPGGPIEVNIAKAGDSALLEVRDHGPGLDESDVSRIFGRFERGSTTSPHGGMGLGLYIAQQIAEAHGGAVSASKVEKDGARFTVSLPLTTGDKISDENAAGNQ